MDEAATAQTRVAAGSVGAPGLAAGPLWIIEEQTVVVAAQSGAGSRATLEGALVAAREELSALLATTSDEDEQTLIEFQIAMLEDESLSAPAWAAIDTGVDAWAAWHMALEQQLTEYLNAEDTYFRARSADLRDLRDRVARRLSGGVAKNIPKGSIVVARDLAPSTFLETDWRGGGIALLEGSARSHVAMLARARSVPLLIGCGAVAARSGDFALLDGENGILTIAPDAPSRDAFARRMEHAGQSAAAAAGAASVAREPLRTAQGEPVRLMMNVADGSELATLDATHWDGIGLVRTELLLRTLEDLFDEERQVNRYGAIVRWARGKPVTIRTLDAGGDKPIAGYTLAEGNPFLGTRGVRLSLAAPGPLKTQLRALARAAALGPVRAMVPMVTLPEELEAVRAVLETALSELAAAGIAHARPELGMMVEVPLAALAIDDFDAAFFSIGSNDLVQYLCAASRELGSLSFLQNPLHSAVLGVITGVVGAAARRGIDVSLCGDMAGDPDCVAALLATGLRTLSIAPAAEAGVRAAVARYAHA